MMMMLPWFLALQFFITSHNLYKWRPFLSLKKQQQLFWFVFHGLGNVFLSSRMFKLENRFFFTINSLMMHFKLLTSFANTFTLSRYFWSTEFATFKNKNDRRFLLSIFVFLPDIRQSRSCTSPVIILDFVSHVNLGYESCIVVFLFCFLPDLIR